jgi:hypothetical protein
LPEPLSIEEIFRKVKEGESIFFLILDLIIWLFECLKLSVISFLW